MAVPLSAPAPCDVPIAAVACAWPTSGPAPPATTLQRALAVCDERYRFTRHDLVSRFVAQGWAGNAEAALDALQQLLDDDVVHSEPYRRFADARGPGELRLRFGRRYGAQAKSGLADRERAACAACERTALVKPDADRRLRWRCAACTLANDAAAAAASGTTLAADEAASPSAAAAAATAAAAAAAARGLGSVLSSSMEMLQGMVLQEGPAGDEPTLAEAARAAIAKTVLEPEPLGEINSEDGTPPVHEWLAKDKRGRTGARGLQTAYAPLAFKALRAVHGVTEDVFAESLLDHAFVERPQSGGSSGAAFLYSSDKHFVIKGLTKREADLLTRMLPAYYEHCRQHPDTLLPRVFGLYKVGGPGGVRHYLMVCNNAFDTALRIDRAYDLKGSTAKRFVEPLDQRAAMDRCGRLPTLKDLNWKQPVRLEAGTVAALVLQLEADTGLLARFGVMDYSLLVGIHDGAVETRGGEGRWAVRRSRFQCDFGGLRCLRSGATVFVSLIDVLQEYDMRKAVERFVKTRVLSTVASLVLNSKQDVEVTCPTCKATWSENQAQLTERARAAPGMLVRLDCAACHVGFEMAPMQSTDANISSIEPNAYRERFLGFVRDKVLEAA